MSNHTVMDLDTWFSEFRPIANTVPGGTNGNSGYNVNGVGYMFETYGPDLDFVESHKIENVWTLVDTDGDLYIVEGYHFVNRVGYFITKHEFDANRTYEIPYMLESENEDDNIQVGDLHPASTVYTSDRPDSNGD